MRGDKLVTWCDFKKQSIIKEENVKDFSKEDSTLIIKLLVPKSNARCKVNLAIRISSILLALRNNYQLTFIYLFHAFFFPPMLSHKKIQQGWDHILFFTYIFLRIFPHISKTF